MASIQSKKILEDTPKGFLALPNLLLCGMFPFEKNAHLYVYFWFLMQVTVQPVDFTLLWCETI